jgi:hypothetical protein
MRRGVIVLYYGRKEKEKGIFREYCIAKYISENMYTFCSLKKIL